MEDILEFSVSCSTEQVTASIINDTLRVDLYFGNEFWKTNYN